MTTQKAREAILAQQITDCDLVIANATKLKAQLPQLIEFFETLETKRFVYYYPNSASIIVAIKTRDDLAKVRALYKGIWTRSQGYETEENLCYTATIEGIHFDVRVTETPPSCHIVEEVVNVPASVRKIRRLMCTDPTKEHAKNGQIISSEVVPV